MSQGGGDGNWLDGSVSGLGAAAALPDDGGVELSSVQIDHSEGGRGETFTKARQRGPGGLHVCGGGVTGWARAYSRLPWGSVLLLKDGIGHLVFEFHPLTTQHYVNGGSPHCLCECHQSVWKTQQSNLSETGKIKIIFRAKISTVAS